MPADFVCKDLVEGVAVELEHTDDPMIAMEIAMDHLVEDPNYYRKLAKVHLDNPPAGRKIKWCDVLPEDPWRYFTKPHGTVLLPLDALKPIRARPEGIKHARELMTAACEGRFPRRKPITVREVGGGLYEVVDGNSTFAVAKWADWSAIPATIERSTNPKFRYTAVPVDTDADRRDEVAVVTRARRRDEAIAAVARSVPDDALVNVGRTRSFPTKHEAIRHAHEVAPDVRVLARRLSRGETR